MTYIKTRINERNRIRYMDWIIDTGIRCAWNYFLIKHQNWMEIEFIEDQDAIAFRLKFNV